MSELYKTYESNIDNIDFRLDTERINTFNTVQQLPYMSKRFAMKRFLGLTEEELLENEQMWREERDDPELETKSGQDLRSVGVTPAGLESDISTGEEIAGMGPTGGDIAAGPAAAPGAVAGAPAGGAAPPAV